MVDLSHPFFVTVYQRVSPAHLFFAMLKISQESMCVQSTLGVSLQRAVFLSRWSWWSGFHLWLEVSYIFFMGYP
jgi:hypothetical protein